MSPDPTMPNDFNADSHDGKDHPAHVVFGTLVHGNERGSLPAAVRLVEALRSGDLRTGIRVSVFIGNPEAAREGVRYLEADLNRVFLENDHTQHEHKRARQIMPILDSADVFIDFHQTILQTQQPFYIFPWHGQGRRWARAMQSASVWVTRGPSSNFSSGTRCTDEYVCLRGKPGLTLELSEKGFSQAAEDLCFLTMVRAIQTAEAEALGEETVDQAASRRPDLTFFETRHRELFATPKHALRPGLVNFQPVQAGESLSAEDSPPIIAPDSGMLLFPKYPPRKGALAQPPLPGEIYRLITPMSAHPAELWGDE